MPKELTISDMLRLTLEDSLKARQIAFTRKNNGLRLAIFGNPEVFCDEDGIRLSIIGGMSSNFNSSAEREHLEFRHGALEDPNTDPQRTIDRVLVVVDTIVALMGDADNKKDVQKMRLCNLPASTAKAAVRKLLKEHAPEALKICKITCRNNAVYVDGPPRPAPSSVLGQTSGIRLWFSVYDDGTGVLKTSDYTVHGGAIVPLEELFLKQLGQLKDASRGTVGSDK